MHLFLSLFAILNGIDRWRPLLNTQVYWEVYFFFFYVFRYPLSLNCLNFVAGDVLKGYILSIMIYKNYIFNTLQCFRDNSILIM